MEFRCEKCLSNLLNYENLKHHQYFCKTQNICGTCNLQCLNSGHLSSHLKWCENAGPKEYRCKKCKCQMFNEDNLIHHNKLCGYFIEQK